MTSTEKYIYEICNDTFLSLWSFPNPIGKKRKELCDILLVCEPNIIIFSVKDILVKGSDRIAQNRWLKKAIDESVKQLHGAERFLKSADNILLKDRETKITLDKSIDWKIYKIAIAFGRGNKFPIQFGDFGKGFVHVFDEVSSQIVLTELDTIKDFINYLSLKEAFLSRNINITFYGEEDLLGLYYSNNFSFPEDPDMIIFGDNYWRGVQNDESYKQNKDELKISYQWDKIINILINDYQNDKLITDTKREQLELTLRGMALEDRQSRILLSEQFLDFIGFFQEPKSVSRIIKSPENKGLLYLFLLEDSFDREYRLLVLQMRCLVARYLNNDCSTIIGIATERYSPKGFSLDFVYLNIPEMDNAFKNKAQNIINEFGFFKNPIKRSVN